MEIAPDPLSKLLLSSEPFHIVFDQDLVVTAVGNSLVQLGGPGQVGLPLSCVIEAIRPRIDLTFPNLVKRRETVFSCVYLPTGMSLRGQILVDNETKIGVFVGTPWFAKVKDYAQRDIRLDMLPIHYGMVETLFLLQTNQATIEDFQRLTDQMQAQKVELEQARQELQASYEARTRFFAMMSHEIRTPMSGIKGMIDILQDSELSPSQAEYFSTLDNCVKSLMVILDDILDFSKIDFAKLQLNPEPFHLGELIGSTADLMRPTAVGKGLEFQIDHDGELDAWVSGDRHRIRQVILNLLSNALKFTSEGSVSIGIRRSPAEDYWSFEVVDTGRGMHEDALGRLFHPFVQESAETASSFGGTGLGLYICRNLVELMGGEMSVESELGVGTRFHFRIPLPSHQEVVAETEAPPTASPVAGKRILVAEDNDTIAMVLEHFLESMEAVSVRVATGEAAVAAFSQERFDLILMDCHMPLMDGFEATRRIRAVADWPIPVVALTASTTMEDEDACRAAGMDAFVSKPISGDQLRDVLAKYVA